MAKKEKEGVFSSVAFSKEENEMHDKKINAMSKKKLVQLIYGMGNVLDKELRYNRGHRIVGALR